LRAIDAAILSHNGLLFAVAQREDVDEPTPERLYTLGVIARIGQIQRGLGGCSSCSRGSRGPTRYTPAGGDIMFVEAAIRRLYGVAPADATVQVGGWGTVSLILTGQLGDAMKESARAA